MRGGSLIIAELPAEMMTLVRAGKVTLVPVTTRKLDEADAALQDLRKGVIMGRAMLVP